MSEYVLFGFDSETDASRVLSFLHENEYLLKAGMFLSVRGPADRVAEWAQDESDRAKRAAS